MKKSITLMMVLAIITLAAGQVPSNGLIAWYSFNDSIKTNITAIKDSTSNKNNANAYTGALPGAISIITTNPDVSTTGLLSGYTHALEINTNTSTGNQSVSAPSLKGFPQNNDSVTISIWYYKTVSTIITTKARQNLISLLGAANMIQIFEIDSASGASSVYAYINGGTPYAQSNKIRIPPSTSGNNWHHLVLVWGKPTLKLYHNSIDTVSTLNDSLSLNIYNATLTMGFSNAATSYSGYIGDVRIYNRALQISEVLQLYNECHSTGVAPIHKLASCASQKNYNNNVFYDLMGRSIQKHNKNFPGIYIDAKNKIGKITL